MLKKPHPPSPPYLSYKTNARPGVILSFVVGGISSLLSALVYAEFAAQYPIAGGAFNYISLSFGELAAWMVVTTLIMEYILSQAAVSRSFTFYFAKLIGKDSKFFLVRRNSKFFLLTALCVLGFCSCSLPRAVG